MVGEDLKIMNLTELKNLAVDTFLKEVEMALYNASKMRGLLNDPAHEWCGVLTPFPKSITYGEVLDLINEYRNERGLENLNTYWN